MPMIKFTYLDGTTHTVELDELENGLLPGYINNATVTLLSLNDAVSGAAVLGQTFPVVLGYVAGSNGRYLASLDYDLVVTIGQRLTGIIIADAGSGLQRKWTLEGIVERG